MLLILSILLLEHLDKVQPLNRQNLNNASMLLPVQVKAIDLASILTQSERMQYYPSVFVGNVSEACKVMGYSRDSFYHP